jgi:hypothetical protein
MNFDALRLSKQLHQNKSHDRLRQVLMQGSVGKRMQDYLQVSDLEHGPDTADTP